MSMGRRAGSARGRPSADATAAARAGNGIAPRAEGCCAAAVPSAIRTPAASARASRGMGLPDADPALLAHELLHVVRTPRAAARRAARFPAAERIDAGPRAGRCAGPAVRVEHAGLHLIEELLDLLVVLLENPGRQAVFRAV